VKPVATKTKSKPTPKPKGRAKTYAKTIKAPRRAIPKPQTTAPKPPKTDQEPKLNRKQQLFVHEYLVDLDAKHTAIRAGYSAHSAYQIGVENLSKMSMASRLG